jgi:hypothetical protein
VLRRGNMTVAAVRDRPLFRRMAAPLIRADGFVAPIPALAAQPPSGPDWAHEVKHDGYRLIVRRDGKAVRLFTRRGHDWTDRYLAIAAAAEKLRARSFTLDGEAVVSGADGIGIFDALHRRHRATDAMLYAFDLLELNGTDLRPLQRTPRRGRSRGVPTCLQARAGGHRVEEAQRALPVGTLPGLDQGQEFGQPGDAAGAGGDVVILEPDNKEAN